MCDKLGGVSWRVNFGRRHLRRATDQRWIAAAKSSLSTTPPDQHSPTLVLQPPASKLMLHSALLQRPFDVFWPSPPPLVFRPFAPNTVRHMDPSPSPFSLPPTLSATLACPPASVYAFDLSNLSVRVQHLRPQPSSPLLRSSSLTPHSTRSRSQPSASTSPASASGLRPSGQLAQNN